uniref:SAS-6_N domain-containing protein n=1 Tax=Macrostomum lignano TaxID=282301 RepID=A0A1I8FF98_9PLAT
SHQLTVDPGGDFPELLPQRRSQRYGVSFQKLLAAIVRQPFEPNDAALDFHKLIEAEFHDLGTRCCVIVIQEANTMSCSRASSATSTRSLFESIRRRASVTPISLQNWISERMNTEQALTAKINGLLFDAGLARLRRRQVASEAMESESLRTTAGPHRVSCTRRGPQWSLERARMHTEYLETINRRGFHPDGHVQSLRTLSGSPRSRPSVSAPGPLAPSSATAAEQHSFCFAAAPASLINTLFGTLKPLLIRPDCRLCRWPDSR